MGIVDDLKAMGFEHWNTGGNCTALVLVLKTGQHWVATDQVGTCYPEQDDWMICLYSNEDWQPPAMAQGCSRFGSWDFALPGFRATLGID